MYLITSFVFFMLAGVMALLIRAELMFPGMQLMNNETYNQLFTMHGTIMLFLFATPLFVGFANSCCRCRSVSPDWPSPGSTVRVLPVPVRRPDRGSWVLHARRRASFGWFAYAPLSDAVRSRGLGGDLWIMGLAISGLNHPWLGELHHHGCARARPDDHVRMPIFTWNVVLTSVLVLFAFPVFTVPSPPLPPTASSVRSSSTPAHGGADPLQHLFWFFGHPEVYIIALPFFGIVTEILPVFSRKRSSATRPHRRHHGDRGTLDHGVGAPHVPHRRGAAAVLLLMTFLIAVPTGVKFFNWIGTMWRGQLTFESPMLFSIGFMMTFLFGGLTGVILASRRWTSLTDSYFVVAHFHYVVFGTVVFAMFAGFYFWWPKFTGQMLDETLGKCHFWTLFFGFHGTFLVQHWLGAEGMPRRYADYLPHDGFTVLNQISSVGAFLLGASTLPFLYNVWKTRKNAPKVDRRRPVGLRPLPGVGDLLPAAAAQLHLAAADPLRAPGVRPAPPVRGDLRRSPEPATATRSRKGAPCGSSTPVHGRLQLRRCGRRDLRPGKLVPHRPGGVDRYSHARHCHRLWVDGRLLAAHGSPAQRALPRPAAGGRLDAEIEEGAGEYGFFSPHSWWPLFVAMAVAFTAVGVAVGWWMTAIGFLAIILTVIGWVFEYYRGEFQH